VRAPSGLVEHGEAEDFGTSLLESGLVAGDEGVGARGDGAGDLGAEVLGIGGELGAGLERVQMKTTNNNEAG
jgi:hypothetical protein